MKENLLLSTNAYKIIKKDVERNSVSHAYLVVCQDEKNLRYYLKQIATVLLKANKGGRAYELINGEKYADVKIYPQDESKKIVTADVDELVEDSFLMPFEAEKKIYILTNASQMNTQSQNKILKTLEEPPESVIILIGATAEFQILPTVISRVKKLEIPDFSEDVIINCLKDEYSDINKLKTAVAISGGKAGEAESLYGDEKAVWIRNFTVDMIKNLKKSSDTLKYSAKINKDNVNNFLAMAESVVRDMLFCKHDGKTLILGEKEKTELGEVIEEYAQGALQSVLKKINEYKRALVYNANPSIIADGVMMSLLEEKHRWQKL